MRIFVSIALLALTAQVPCLAQELLFAGQVQHVTLVPDGVGACEAACPSSPPDKNGMQKVCISNSPGCELAEVKVLEPYVGTTTEIMQFRSRIGEWGRSRIPIRSDPILVYVRHGETSWAPLVERDRKMYIDATSMRRLGKVDLQELASDKDGLVPLDVLIARVLSAK